MPFEYESIGQLHTMHPVSYTKGIASFQAVKWSRRGVNPSRHPGQVKKGKAFPLQAWTGPWGSQRLMLQNF
jgi:hypothetical protein